MQRIMVMMRMGALLLLTPVSATMAQTPAPTQATPPANQAQRPVPPPPAGGDAAGLWFVAEKLAAAELALGITPEQQAPWRAFAQAAVRLAEAGSSAPGPGSGQAGGVDQLRLMLEGEIRQGEAAASVFRAMDALGAALSPEQRETANRLLGALPTVPVGSAGSPVAPPPPSAAPTEPGGATPPRFDKPSLFTR